jgi:hypothetical protein
MMRHTSLMFRYRSLDIAVLVYCLASRACQALNPTERLLDSGTMRCIQDVERYIFVFLVQLKDWCPTGTIARVNLRCGYASLVPGLELVLCMSILKMVILILELLRNCWKDIKEWDTRVLFESPLMKEAKSVAYHYHNNEVIITTIPSVIDFQDTIVLGLSVDLLDVFAMNPSGMLIFCELCRRKVHSLLGSLLPPLSSVLERRLCPCQAV